jgi:aminoglycoside phosphotransferase (APT) family kinase protein
MDRPLAPKHDRDVEGCAVVNTPLVAFDSETAMAALIEACAVVGLDPTDAALVRLGSNAVFRLRTSPVIARVGRDARRLPDAERELAVSRWLFDSKVPAVRALDVPQPIVAKSRVVTMWESHSDREEYGSTADLAKLLLRLHGLAAPKEFRLPVLSPFDRARHRIDRAVAIGEDDRIFLSERWARLRAAYDSLEYALPAGVIHGDASVGNVILDRQGRALLADLDGFVVGPREWDLVLTAIYYERFGWHTDHEYQSFVAGYGYDVMTWSGYSVLCDVRELLMVSWLAQNADKNPEAARELAKRIHTLRTDSSRLDWKPF